jgi:hypothetical protein
LHPQAAEGASEAASAARLTAQHKRELARLSAAALVSTVVALAPLLLHDARKPATLTAIPLPVADVRLPEPADTTLRFMLVRSEPARAVYARRAAGARETQLARAENRGASPTIALASLESSAIGDEPEAPLMRVRERLLRSPADRPGGLSRLLLGSGRHRVQPFPQPAGSD